MRKKNLLVILSVTLFISLACNIGNTATPNVNIVAKSVALTVEAGEQTSPTVAGMPSPLPTMPPAVSPTTVFTPTITLTATPSVPMVSVSVDTNCRTGPGKAYDQIGALMTSEKAEAVGKNTASDYWIIKNPDANGTCWLWGYYATIAGNTSNLQEYAVPPTPTPVQTPTPIQTPTPPIPNAPSNLFAVTKKCIFVNPISAYNLTVNLTWVNDPAGVDILRSVVYAYRSPFIEVPGNQTASGDMLFTVQAGVPSEFGVSTVNTTGASPQAVIQVTCP